LVFAAGDHDPDERGRLVAVAHRIYADALFQAALERGRLDKVREDLGEFVAAVETVPALDALLTNPELDRGQRRAALEGILDGADELVRNFVLLAAEKNRAGQIGEIFREFERLVAQQERRLEVELTTAVALSDEEAQSIVSQIQKAAGRSVEATRAVDPDLVGGFVLQAGSLRVDASIRGRLERLRHELARS
jgi:ATP synthase F1 delta subunit